MNIINVINQGWWWHVLPHQVSMALMASFFHGYHLPVTTWIVNGGEFILIKVNPFWPQIYMTIENRGGEGILYNILSFYTSLLFVYPKRKTTQEIDRTDSICTCAIKFI